MNGYFNSIFNPGAGSPSSFTSPGMNPYALAQLLQMQGGVNGIPQPAQSNIAPNPLQQAQFGNQGIGFGQSVGAPSLQAPYGQIQGADPLAAARMAQIYQLLQRMGGNVPGGLQGAVPQSAGQPFGGTNLRQFQ